jgi:hypothetical protein
MYVLTLHYGSVVRTITHLLAYLLDIVVRNHTKLCGQILSHFKYTRGDHNHVF